MARVVAETKQPLGCSDAEIVAFCCFVRQGGEVEPAGLEGRVRTARSLVFLYVDSVLVAVAAMKRPGATYRADKFHAAGKPREASRYSHELGWVFVLPEHRGKRYSHVVASAAMSQADGAPVFATTRADNAAMQKTLKHLGFARLGDTWKSGRGDYKLALFVVPLNIQIQGTKAAHATGIRR